ncbi:hypothetical protein SteCoe_21390 [Stentor coeruleus]|uniref:USP domain-containing protein n=1 Tax=Stentor coeruleus TaxID=5963 RepID=A0A1R2BPV2_9CILI|nr:hypothetical protein SteCoe_21390 [Stentor coeruleus]
MKCRHIKKLASIDYETIITKFKARFCEKCGKKEDLYINFMTYETMCELHFARDQLQLKKDQLQVICKQFCNSIVALENTKIKDLIPMLEINKKNIRILGCTGLLNLGNTCYINTIIQALSSILCIKTYFLKYVIRSKAQGILMQFCELLDAMWRGERYYDPSRFLTFINGEIFTDMNRFRHQDTLEFFHFFHTTIDNNLKVQLGSNFFSDCFLWKTNISLQCIQCQTSSIVQEEFFELPLCIPQKEESKFFKDKSYNLMSDKDKFELEGMTNSIWKKAKLFVNSRSLRVISLYECLYSYFKTEKLDDQQNLRMCDHCNSKQESEKNQKIKSLPPVLVIALKRYYSTNTKIPLHVQLPIILNLNEFSQDKDLPLYELSSVISHKGDLHSGHYFAYCKHQETGFWFKFNDRKVSRRTEEQVLQKQAYIAFYTDNFVMRNVKKGKFSVPVEWFNRFKCIKNPMQIPFEKYICEHDKIKPGYSIEDFKKVRYDDVKNYTEREEIRKLKPCEECKKIV